MYESFYGLRAKPFQLTPDPRFFFNSRGHKRALAYLRYGVRQGEGFILITGDVGTGKTLLVGTLFGAITRENVVTAHVVSTQLGAEDLVRTVAAAFGLPYERVDKATLLRSLESHFRACVREGKRVLLVVDEAQNLSRRALEELRMLSNFQVGGRNLVQSFLLGQKEFRTTLRSEAYEQLRQRVIAAYHLRPLDRDETRGYIEHRLLTAGWRGDPRLISELFDRIHEFTGGVPRRINTLCDRLLLYGYIEELHTFDTQALEDVIDEMLEERGAPTDAALHAPGESEDGAGDRAALESAGGPAEPEGFQESGEAPAEAPGETAEGEVPPAAPPPAETSPERAAGAAPAGDDRSADAGAGAESSNDERLSAVEESVANLSDSMQKEIGLLRDLLLERSRYIEASKRADEDDDDHRHE